MTISVPPSSIDESDSVFNMPWPALESKREQPCVSHVSLAGNLLYFFLVQNSSLGLKDWLQITSLSVPLALNIRGNIVPPKNESTVQIILYLILY
jgi:hypothetical protein